MSARDRRRKGLKTFDPRPETRRARRPASPPSSIRGGFEVAQSPENGSVKVFGDFLFRAWPCGPSGLSDDWAPPIQHCHAPRTRGSRAVAGPGLDLQHPSSLAARFRGYDNDRTAWASLILIWTARNSLKSPRIGQGIRENQSPFSWSGLVWIGFGSGEFGLKAFRVVVVGRTRLSILANGAPVGGVAKAITPGRLRQPPGAVLSQPQPRPTCW